MTILTAREIGKLYLELELMVTVIGLTIKQIEDAKANLFIGWYPLYAV
jgi:hypothetical protein